MDYPNELKLHQGLLDELKKGFRKEFGKPIEEISPSEFSEKSEKLLHKAGVLSEFRHMKDLQAASMLKRFRRALNPRQGDTPSIEIYDFICYILLEKGISDCALLFRETVVVKEIYSSKYSKTKRNRRAKTVAQPKPPENKIQKAVWTSDSEKQWRHFFNTRLHKEPRITYNQLKQLMTIAGYEIVQDTPKHIAFIYPGKRHPFVIQNGKPDAGVYQLVLAKVLKDIISNKIPEGLIEKINREM